MAPRVVVRTVYEVGTLVGRYPIALPIARWRRHGEPLARETEVVIEGFPRSANTLAVATFVESQPRHVRIAHHVHAPAHVIEGARRGLPTLVLIRDPRSAVTELVLLKPALTVAQALRGWLRFYRPLLRHHARFVVASTEDVASDFGDVVRRLNRRFGTSFRDVELTHETRRRIGRAMAGYRQGREGPGLPLVGRTDETEEGRDADRERLRAVYDSARLAGLRSRAERLHSTFAALAR